jgi:hypothetical protein
MHGPIAYIILAWWRPRQRRVERRTGGALREVGNGQLLLQYWHVDVKSDL